MIPPIPTKLTEDIIRREADARNLDLSKPLDELRPQIESLKAGTLKPFADSEDLVSLVVSSLQSRILSRFTPFEMLSRIHDTQKKVQEDGSLICSEISRPIHYFENDEVKAFVVKTPNFFNCPPNIKEIYKSSLERAAQERKTELETQTATFLDTLLINRRLVGSNVRCVKAREGPILCFEYDWRTGELL